MTYFEYGAKEINYLKSQDERLSKVIDHLGKPKREVNPNLFSSLISSMIGQQVSTKAASTVKQRLEKQAGSLEPNNLSKLTIDEIQKCGMSHRKAGYIQSITKDVVEKKIDLSHLKSLDDESFIEEITKIKGIGRWTAEMMLLHSLERLDVFSYNDLGILRGIKKLYNIDTVSKDFFDELKRRYSPYGSVASIYLWRFGRDDDTNA